MGHSRNPLSHRSHRPSAGLSGNRVQAGRGRRARRERQLAARDAIRCIIAVTPSNYRAYDMASIPLGVSMRAAVAGVCALLSPLLLAATLQAQEPERVVRELSLRGQPGHPGRGARRRDRTTTSSWFARVFLVRWLGLGREAVLQRGGVPARRHPAPRPLPPQRISQRRWWTRPCVREPQNVYITFRITEGAPMVVDTLVQVTGLDSLPAWLRRIATLDLPLQVGDPFNRYLMQAERRLDRAAAAGPRLSLRHGVLRLRGRPAARWSPG